MARSRYSPRKTEYGIRYLRIANDVVSQLIQEFAHRDLLNDGWEELDEEAQMQISFDLTRSVAVEMHRYFEKVNH